MTWHDRPPGRRQAERVETGGGACIVFGDERRGCRVVNFSATGARLEIGRAPLPDEFNLEFLGHIYGCRQVWRTGDEIGIEFRLPVEPTRVRPISVRALRQQFGLRGTTPGE